MMELQREPLFGIIVILAIIALIGLADFWRMRYFKKEARRSLKNLVKNYDFKGADEKGENTIMYGIDMLLELGKENIPALMFVAKSYERNGEMQEAIKIYLSLLESKHSSTSKIEILEALGRAYHKAGFLQRAKNIFLEILKTYPRNIDILLYLMRTYESLGEYKNAIEALECLEELYRANIDSADDRIKQTISLNKLYLKILIQEQDSNRSVIQNCIDFLRYKEAEPRLERVILKYLKKYNKDIFWKEVDKSEESSIQEIIDILWNIDKADVPFAHISNKSIFEIYLAKGYLDEIEGLNACSDFALEQKRLMDKYSTFKTNFSFEYRCNSCKHIFPFDNVRCPMCGDLLNISLIYKVKRIDHEASYSLL